MAKILFALVATLCLATSASASLNFVEQGIDIAVVTNEQHLRYYFACLRGFSDGFGRGLFRNESETTSQECLGENTVKHTNELKGYIASGNILEIFKSIGKFYQIGFDMQK